MADASRFDVPYKLLQREAGDAGTTVPLQLSADMAGPAASVSTDDVNALCWAGGACLPRRTRPPGFVTCRWRRPRSGRHPEGEVALAVQDELLLVPEGAQLDGHGLHRPVAAVRAAAVRCDVVPTAAPMSYPRGCSNLTKWLPCPKSKRVGARGERASGVPWQVLRDLARAR